MTAFSNNMCCVSWESRAQQSNTASPSALAKRPLVVLTGTTPPPCAFGPSAYLTWPIFLSGVRSSPGTPEDAALDFIVASMPGIRKTSPASVANLYRVAPGLQSAHPSLARGSDPCTAEDP